ncbi:nuclease homologue [Rhodovulum sp. ES.010]|uniref:thermonuclease family protein n=1 Tax=Rhodovulum sp. ES.010 TaxID=1882821 RepID=UPI0009282927|nr:thermonuclease family protein [Rhodovulum sp. ES.010]SIO36146.1 nuclease homologue [Rhodovulum sp. ES.010]
MSTLAALLMLTAYTIVDGDTLSAGDTGIRLWGIDAPERGEDGAAAATAALADLAGAGPLRCEVKDVDPYRRIVARCVTPDGRDLACELVAQGHARDWPRYSGGAYAGCDPGR